MRSSLIVLNSLRKFSIIHFSLLVVVLIYGYSFYSIGWFDAMCRCSVLWAVISFYVPSFRSMSRYSGLCSFVLFYGPLSRSMFRPHNLWTVLLFYGPPPHSM